MRISFISLTLLLLLLMAAGCGGNSSTSTSSSQISGAYEYVVTSNVTKGTTLIEANMTANGTQSGATGPSKVQILTLEKKIWYVNGVCFGSTPGQNSVTTSLSGTNVAVTFNEGGNPFSGQGVVTGSGISGNYSVSDSPCPDLIGVKGIPAGTDNGGFVANQVPDLSGTFTGPINLLDATDNASLTLTESSGHSLTVNVTLSGSSNSGTFAFTGSAVGNVMYVSGSINGTALTLFGYLDRTGTFTGTANSMLVFDYDTLTQAGLLIDQ